MDFYNVNANELGLLWICSVYFCIKLNLTLCFFNCWSYILASCEGRHEIFASIGYFDELLNVQKLDFGFQYAGEYDWRSTKVDWEHTSIFPVNEHCIYCYLNWDCLLFLLFYSHCAQQTRQSYYFGLTDIVCFKWGLRMHKALLNYWFCKAPHEFNLVQS